MDGFNEIEALSIMIFGKPSREGIEPLGVYKFGWGWRLFGTIVGLLMAAGSLYLMLTALRARYLFVPGTFMGVWIVIAAHRSSLTLYSDIVEVHGAFFTRWMARDQIVSKTYAGANGIFLWRDKRGQWPFQVATQLDADETFWNWINSIPTGFPYKFSRQKK